MERKVLPLKLISYNLNLMKQENVIPHAFFITVHFRGKSPKISKVRACRIHFQDKVKTPKAVLGNHMIQLTLKELRIYAPKYTQSKQNRNAALGVRFRVIPTPEKTSVHNWGGGKPSEVILAPFRTSTSKPNLPNEQKNISKPQKEKGKIDSIIQQWKEGKVSWWFIFLAIILAFWMGAGHALAPGHGKTMVAGYLIGTRGRVKDAIYLGIIVTFTHVSSVYLLSILMWIASDIFTQERVFPWMTIGSGAIIFFLGMIIFGRKNDHGHTHSHGHSHSHDHSHSHGHSHTHNHENSSIAFKELLWLGISGGMIPCPSAMVVLLTSIALGVSGFGILLVTFFSLGLAIVLIVIGVLVVLTKEVAVKFDKQGKLLSILPKLSGLFVTLLGITIALKGAQMAGFISIHLSF